MNVKRMATMAAKLMPKKARPYIALALLIVAGAVSVQYPWAQRILEDVAETVDSVAMPDAGA
jgi:hypothetical protein